jgi:hypothetical protein
MPWGRQAHHKTLYPSPTGLSRSSHPLQYRAPTHTQAFVDFVTSHLKQVQGRSQAAWGRV